MFEMQTQNAFICHSTRTCLVIAISAFDLLSPSANPDTMTSRPLPIQFTRLTTATVVDGKFLDPHISRPQIFGRKFAQHFSTYTREYAVVYCNIHGNYPSNSTCAYGAL